MIINAFFASIIPLIMYFDAIVSKNDDESRTFNFKVFIVIFFILEIISTPFPVLNLSEKHKGAEKLGRFQMSFC